MLLVHSTFADLGPVCSVMIWLRSEPMSHLDELIKHVYIFLLFSFLFFGISLQRFIPLHLLFVVSLLFCPGWKAEPLWYKISIHLWYKISIHLWYKISIHFTLYLSVSIQGINSQCSSQEFFSVFGMKIWYFSTGRWWRWKNGLNCEYRW